MKIYKVYKNGELDAWCYEDIKAEIEKRPGVSTWTFEEVPYEPIHLDYYARW